MARLIILWAALLFAGGLLFMTISVMVDSGPDIFTLLSFLVVGMFAFGIVGALREPPR